jgi:hypothetical protein
MRAPAVLRRFNNRASKTSLHGFAGAIDIRDFVATLS